MRKKVLILSCLTVLISALAASTFIMFAYLINAAVERNTDNTLIFMLVTLGILVVMGLLKALVNNLQYKYFNAEEMVLRNELFVGLNKENVDLLTHLPTEKFQELFNTDIYNIVGNKIYTIPKIVKNISKVFFILVAFVYMMIAREISPIALIPLLIFGGALVPIGINYNKKSIEYKQKDKDGRDYTEKFLAETGEIISLVKAVDAYDSSADYYKKLNYDYLKIKNKTSSVLTLGKTGLYVTSLLIFAIIVLCSVFFISRGQLSVGALVFMLLIVNNTHRAFLSPIPIKEEIARYKESAERFTYLKAPEAKVIPLGVNDFKAISFENVSFANEGKYIIKDLSFKIKAGDRVLLKGPAKSGKSIIFKLLLGLLKPTVGNIYLDTVQMRIELGKEESHLFSFVPQDNLLYSCSVLDNFYILTRVIDMDRIKESLKLACVLDELPDLNVSARELSEDVVQRILIAMAIATDEKIMLIDNFASTLDAKTAKNIYENLKGLNKTIIYISNKAYDENDKIIEIK